MNPHLARRKPSALADPADPAHAHLIARLNNDRIGWLATTRGDGHPQAVPVWFVYVEDVVVVFSAAWSAKTHHLRERPSCSFCLETQDDDDDCVLVDGVAETLDADDPLLAAAEATLTRKYELGDRVREWRMDFAVPIAIHPTRIVAWRKPDGTLDYVKIERRTLAT